MSRTPKNEASLDILVVDDIADNLRLLFGILSEAGYNVRLAASASLALTSLQHTLPDLILMDIVMPGMDGLELCQRLKSKRDTSDIPVIFVSARGQIEDKILAFEAGGVDFISKPFQAAEVLARVSSHIRIINLQNQLRAEIAERYAVETALKERNRELEATNALLKSAEQELARASSAQNRFYTIVGHDLRNTFSGLYGTNQLLVKNARKYDREKIQRQVDKVNTAAEKINNLLNNLLIWSRFERNLIEIRPRLFQFHSLVNQILILYQPQADRKQITLKNEIDHSADTVFADLNLMNMVTQNLISNAIKYTHPGGKIGISSVTQDGQVVISIMDNGIGMSRPEVETLFNLEKKYSRKGTAGEEGTGLGLILCAELIAKCGGTIRAKSQPDNGTTISIMLPSTPGTDAGISSISMNTG